MIIVPDTPSPALPDEVLKASVVKVFDGDGFLANLWHPTREAWVPRIAFRFAFIDAPELEQPFGLESKEFLSRLIIGKTLRLDPIGKESTGGVPIDQYKCILCMGFLTEQIERGSIHYHMNGICNVGSVKRVRSVTRNIELEMIANGWAWVVEQYSLDREAEYFAVQDDARCHQRGLWAMENPEPPWSFKRPEQRRKRAAEGQGRLF